MSKITSITRELTPADLAQWLLDKQGEIKSVILVCELHDDTGTTVIKSGGSISFQDVAWSIATLQAHLFQELAALM